MLRSEKIGEFGVAYIFATLLSPLRLVEESRDEPWKIVRFGAVAMDCLALLLWAGCSIGMLASSTGRAGNDCPHNFQALTRGFGWFGVLAFICGVLTFIDQLIEATRQLSPLYRRIVRGATSAASTIARVGAYTYLTVAAAFIFGEEGGYAALSLSCPTQPLRATAAGLTAIAMAVGLQLVGAVVLTISAWVREVEPACHQTVRGWAEEEELSSREKKSLLK